MRQPKTNTSEKVSLRRIALVAAAAFSLAIYPLATLRADTFDTQIQALQQELERYQAEAGKLQEKADTLQNAINELNVRQAALETQIQQNEVELRQLNEQIDQTEDRIENQKEALARNLRSMYLESSITPLEMIASSRSIGDFIDKQEYRNTIRDAVRESLDEIRELKATLEDQQKRVEQKLAEQKAANRQLATQKTEKDKLLAQTQGEEAAYQRLSGQRRQEIAALQELQRAAFEQAFGTGFSPSGSYGSLEYRNLTPNVPCGGGYPGYYCAYAQDSLVDEWDLYNRECVSYAAWAATYRFGKTNPVLTSSNPSIRGFNGSGNAGQWPYYMNGRYGAVANSTPAVGSVVVIPPEIIGGVGHVAVVESVDGGWIHVSQYNWAPVDGKYSEMDLKVVPGLVFIHF